MSDIEIMMCDIMSEELLRKLREVGYQNPQITKPSEMGVFYFHAKVTVENDIAESAEGHWPLLWRVCKEMGMSGSGGSQYYFVDLLQPWRSRGKYSAV